MAAQVADLAAAAEVAKRRSVELFVALSKSIRDGRGRSVFHSAAREHGEWSVTDPDGSLLGVFEGRSDAVEAVADVVRALEREILVSPTAAPPEESFTKTPVRDEDHRILHVIVESSSGRRWKKTPVYDEDHRVTRVVVEPLPPNPPAA